MRRIDVERFIQNIASAEGHGERERGDHRVTPLQIAGNVPRPVWARLISLNVIARPLRS